MPFKLPANRLSVWIHTDKHNSHSHTPTHALHNLCERTFRSAFSSIYKWCLWVWTEDGCVRIQFARNAPLYPNHYGNRCECSVAYSHNSIQFDSVRHDSPSVWVDLISISIAILLFSISNQNSQSVSRGRKANPHALYLYCLCVCVSMTAHWRTEVFEKRFRQSHETRGQGRVYVSCHWLYLYLCLCCCCCFYRCHCRQVLSIKIKQKATLCLDHASYSCGYMGVKCAWESSCFLAPQQILNQILRNLRTKSRTISIGPRKV